MLGFSWAEILLTSAVALIVIGPKDIPKVLFQIGRVARRLQQVRLATSRQFDDFLKEHDLDDLHHDVKFEGLKEAGSEAGEAYHKPVNSGSGGSPAAGPAKIASEPLP